MRSFMLRISWVIFSMLVASSVSAVDATERRLYSDRIESSSFLWNDWNRFQENFHPLYAMDGDPATAWVEGSLSAGAGEWIKVQLSPLEGVTKVRLRILNGYHKSDALFKANARAKVIEVKLLPSGKIQAATLVDARDWQEVVLEQPSGPLSAFELKVVSVYDGKKYTDLCLSEFQVFVTATSRDNPSLEKSKLERVTSWKRERASAARDFKSAAKKHMLLAPQYRLELVKDGPRTADGESCRWDTFCLMKAGLDALSRWAGTTDAEKGMIQVALRGLSEKFVSWNPAQPVVNDNQKIPAVDGIRALPIWSCFEGPGVWFTAEGEVNGELDLPSPGVLGYLRNDGLGTFALSNAPTLAAALEAKPAACSSETGSLFAWTVPTSPSPDAPQRLKAMLLVHCGKIEVREGMEQVSLPQLLVYRPDGGLGLIVNRFSASFIEWRDVGGQPVISGARRVSTMGDPAVKLTDPRRVTRLDSFDLPSLSLLAFLSSGFRADPID